eukprot:TRINITY_DN277_c4_g1_i1.p2 TRINITY_DN277_c4_g1~~TRINITY_DN277_c4_g1_i1.p2  ORF type:complete len:176 (+),score=35.01 TRINITY_DN277_c4_g1_i1:48-530(+)
MSTTEFPATVEHADPATAYASPGVGKVAVNKAKKVHRSQNSGGVQKQRAKMISQSKRAKINFPVGRIHRLLREALHGKRVGACGAVYLAAVMDYLCAEILELAGNHAKKANQKRITPRHLMIAIRTDPELDEFIKATIATGGVIPHTKKNQLSGEQPRKR